MSPKPEFPIRRVTTHRPVQDPEHLGGFHWKDGLMFKRNGPFVQIMHWYRDESLPIDADNRAAGPWCADVLAVIPDAEWASIIATVSASGETAENYEAAKAFHGEAPQRPGECLPAVRTGRGIGPRQSSAGRTELRMSESIEELRAQLRASEAALAEAKSLQAGEIILSLLARTRAELAEARRERDAAREWIWWLRRRS